MLNYVRYKVESVFLLLLLLPATGLFAEAPTLESVAKNLAQNNITRGDFVLTRTSAKTNKSLKSSGRWTIAPDHGIIWDTQKPVKTTQVVTTDFMVLQNARGQKKQISGEANAIYSQMATLTSSLFTDKLDTVRTAADINFSYDTNSAVWTIELFPKDESIKQALEKIIVTGYSDNSPAPSTKVLTMTMRMKNGDSTEYQLSNHETGGQLTKEELELLGGK